MLPLLESGRRVVNVDESWLNESTFYRKLWAPKGVENSVPTRTISPRLSVIAAIDTEGHVWFALTQANTDSNVLLTFLRHLIQIMAEQLPGFEKETVFLLDGARYHTSPEMRHYYEQLGVQVMFTAPYSYTTSPIERLFSGLKFGELNYQGLPCGKR